MCLQISGSSAENTSAEQKYLENVIHTSSESAGIDSLSWTQHCLQDHFAY